MRTAISILCLVAVGFRRCGVRHPNTEVHYDDDYFSEDEWSVLEKEPNLQVREVEVDDDTVVLTRKDREGAQVVQNLANGKAGNDSDDDLPGDVVTAVTKASEARGGGKPTVDEVKEQLPDDTKVSAKQRDKAWDIIQGAGAANE